MTATNYFEAARKAQDQLNPLLSQALQEAKDKMEQAKQAADDPRQDELVQAIEEAELLDPGEARQILSDLQADAPPHVKRDGRHLLGRISALERENELNQEECGKIAKALVQILKGEAEGGLVRWPTCSHWSQALNHRQIENYARWIAPDRFEAIQQERRKAQEEKDQAEREVEALELAGQSLKNLIPEGVA